MNLYFLWDKISNFFYKKSEYAKGRSCYEKNYKIFTLPYICNVYVYTFETPLSLILSMQKKQEKCRSVSNNVGRCNSITLKRVYKDNQLQPKHTIYTTNDDSTFFVYI